MFLVLYGITENDLEPVDHPQSARLVRRRPGRHLGVNLTYEELITVGCACGGGSLWFCSSHTRMGVSMRAVVDDPDLASLTGARSGRIAGFAWIIGLHAAGLAGILVAPGTGMSLEILSELVIFGYAAAIVGRLRQLPLTFLGAMILGIAGSMAIGYVPANLLNDVSAALPMGLLIIVLLLLPQGHPVGRSAGPHRPPGPHPSGPRWSGCGPRWGGHPGGLPDHRDQPLHRGPRAGHGHRRPLPRPASGYGGQVWLCQFTFMGIGTWAMTKVDGGSSVLGVLAAIGLCAAAGGAGPPALRLRGLYMALATLAFAVLMDEIFFTNPSVINGGSLTVGRPDIFGMQFVTDRRSWSCWPSCFALCIIGVGAFGGGASVGDWSP